MSILIIEIIETYKSVQWHYVTIMINKMENHSIDVRSCFDVQLKNPKEYWIRQENSIFFVRILVFEAFEQMQNKTFEHFSIE